jgi:rubrerythrin
MSYITKKLKSKIKVKKYIKKSKWIICAKCGFEYKGIYAKCPLCKKKI